MSFKVLYIDDEAKERSQTYADGLSSLGLIEIRVEKPDSFEKLIAELLTEQDNYDSLIIDLKLDGNQSGDRVAKYTAPSLASGIRAKLYADDGFKKEFPIFLISSTENLKKYYDPDTASHDLFDYKFNKIKISEHGHRYEKLIESVIRAYQIIGDNKVYFDKILGEPNDKLIENKIFTSRFLEGDGTTISEISQYIFNEIINKSGVLINEKVLAARLGVDIEKSEDWIKLLSLLDKAEYNGIFKEIQKRWWANDILYWWINNFDVPLIQLEASKRVELIKTKFNFENLVEAEPIPKTTSTRFWTICEAYQKPLDPIDGFLIDGVLIYTWQDKRYISLESILERDASSKGFKIHPEEKERFEDLKQEYL